MTQNNTNNTPVTNNSGTVTRTGIKGITVAALVKALGLGALTEERQYAIGAQLMAYAVATGAARNIGRHHVAGTRGRPTEVYAFSMEALLTSLANCGTIEQTEVTKYEPPAMPLVAPRKGRKSAEVATIKTAPMGRPANLPLDFDDVPDTSVGLTDASTSGLDFDDVGETAPHGVNVPATDDVLEALAEIALFAPTSA